MVCLSDMLHSYIYAEKESGKTFLQLAHLEALCGNRKSLQKQISNYCNITASTNLIPKVNKSAELFTSIN